MFVIDKNVPIPTRKHRNARKSRYPFADMEIGDSFFVPGKTKLASTIGAASKKLGFKFTYAPEGNGLRIWRVESPEDRAALPLVPPAPDILATVELPSAEPVAKVRKGRRSAS